MPYRLLADIVLVGHFVFVAFVVFGGLLVLRWPKLGRAHLPAALWGVVITYTGWICPLTPLEIHLRQRGGEAGYTGGFIEHYLTAVLYPAGLTRGTQVALGSLLLLINVLVYRRVRRMLFLAVLLGHAVLPAHAFSERVNQCAKVDNAKGLRG